MLAPLYWYPHRPITFIFLLVPNLLTSQLKRTALLFQRSHGARSADSECILCAEIFIRVRLIKCGKSTEIHTYMGIYRVYIVIGLEWNYIWLKHVYATKENEHPNDSKSDNNASYKTT